MFERGRAQICGHRVKWENHPGVVTMKLQLNGFGQNIEMSLIPFPSLRYFCCEATYRTSVRAFLHERETDQLTTSPHTIDSCI